MNAPFELLQSPCAHGGPVGDAQLRARPEDFVVREWLGFEPEGEGEHFMLRIEKRRANTMWVAKQLARIGKVHPRDVGFAGLKDRDAVAQQSFTVPVRSAVGENWLQIDDPEFKVLSIARCRRKLKRGALKGNEFEIVLRAFSGDATALEERLQAIRARGAPNYFGPQRFGRDGGNLQRAYAWFAGEAERLERTERGFALSAARAALFNAVLARRVQEGSWSRLLSGDLANLEGSGSIFAVESVDAALIERCERQDIHPTGPLWGVGPPQPAHEVAALEQSVAERFAVLRDGLEREKLESERRALRIAVHDLRWSRDAADVHLAFRLGRGAFATAVLHELISNAFGETAAESED